MSVTKELMECLLSQKEMDMIFDRVWSVGYGQKTTSTYCEAVAKAQLQKVAEYVEAERNKIFKALASYNMGRISGERCAEIIGMNSLEFYDKF